MITSCPLMSNPQVAKEFNEIKDVVGETGAYHIWSANNGNSIDKAPNGEPSILFLKLLERNNNDRNKAISIKSKLYTKGFESKFGQWYDSELKSTIEFDENGEPSIDFLYDYLGVKNYALTELERDYNIDNITSIDEKREDYIQNSFIDMFKKTANYTMRQLNTIKNQASSIYNSLKQKAIMQSSRDILVDSFGLVKETDENGNVRYVSKTMKDGKYDLIVEFVEHLSDETGEVNGWYDYNAKSLVAHNVIKIALEDNDPSTLNHELAHHYVRMFWGSPLIQEALGAVYKKGMTNDQIEEALVDEIVSRQLHLFEEGVKDIFSVQFWDRFYDMLQHAFGKINNRHKELLLKNVANAFEINQDQESVNHQLMFNMSENRMYKRKSAAEKSEIKRTAKIAEQRRLKREERRKSPYIVLDSNNPLQKLVSTIVKGSITRRNILEKYGSASDSQVVQLNIQEQRARDFAEAVNKKRENRKKAIERLKIKTSGWAATRKMNSMVTSSAEEINRSLDFVIDTLRDAENDIEDFIELLSNSESYNFAKIAYSSTGKGESLSRKYIPKGMSEKDVTEEIVDFDKLQAIGKESVKYYRHIHSMLRELKNDTELWDTIDEETKDYLNSLIDNISTKLDDLERLYDKGRKSQVRSFIRNLIFTKNEDGTYSVNKYLAMDESEAMAFYDEACRWMFINNMDVRSLEKAIGVKEFSKSPVVRLLHSVIYQKSRDDERKVNKKANILRTLKRNAKKAQGFGFLRTFDKQFMERDENGNINGNIIGKYNRGKYSREQQAFYNNVLYGDTFSVTMSDGTVETHKSIERQIRERLGDDSFELEVDDSGYPLIPDGMDDIFKSYELANEEWLCNNTEREFMPWYYKKRIEILSPSTLRLEREANKDINDILKLCMVQGRPHTELLSPSQMRSLKAAYRRKSQLRSPYDNYGREKVEGTPEYIAYKELLEWSEYTQDLVYTKDEEAYEESKSKALDKNEFVAQNSYKRITQEFWDMFEEQFPKNPKSSEVMHSDVLDEDVSLEELKQRRSKLVNTIKDSGLSLPQFHIVWDDERMEIRPEWRLFFINLKQLDEAIAELSEEVYNEKKKIKNDLTKKADRLISILDEEGKTKRISWYKYMCACINHKWEESGNPNWREMARRERELITYKPNKMKASEGLSIFKYTKPTRESYVLDDGSEIESVREEPISVYSTIDIEATKAKNKDIINPNYRKDLDENVQPNRKYYNAEYFDLHPEDAPKDWGKNKGERKIKPKPKEVTKYYDELNSTMKEAFSMFPFKGNYHNKAPQIGMDWSDALARYGLTWRVWRLVTKAIPYIWKRFAGVTEEDEDMYVGEFDTRIDGSISRRIPIRYIKAFDDQSQVSANLLGSVISFYDMAVGYKSKRSLSGLCSAIYEQAFNQNPKSNQVTVLKSLIEKNIYDVNLRWMPDATSPEMWKRMYKFARWSGISRNFARIGLLGGNITSGGVAGLDAFMTAVRDVWGGRYANRSGFFSALGHMIVNLPNQILQLNSTKTDYINCKWAKSETASFMNFFGLSEKASRRYKTAHYSALGRMVNLLRSLMSPFSFADYNAKALYMEETLHNVRYYEAMNQFFTEEEFMRHCVINGLSHQEASDLYSNSITIRKALTLDKYGNVKPNVKNKAGKAIYRMSEEDQNALYNLISSRTVSRVSYYNGMVEDTSSTDLQSNPWTGWVTMVRNFMLIMVAHKFTTNDDFFVYDLNVIPEELTEINPEDLENDENFGGSIVDEHSKVNRRIVAQLNQHHRKGYYNFIRAERYSPELQGTFNALFRKDKEGSKFAGSFGRNLWNLASYMIYDATRKKPISNRKLLGEDLYTKYTKESKAKRKQLLVSDTEISQINFVINSIIMIALMSTACAMFHNTYVDEYGDELWFNIVDLLLLRLPTEMMSGFSWQTITELITSVTAGKTPYDNIAIMPLIVDAYNYFFGDLNKPFEIQTNGTFKGQTKLFKDIVNTLSFLGLRNLYKNSTVEGNKATIKFYKEMSLMPIVGNPSAFWKDNKKSMFYSEEYGNSGFSIPTPSIPEINVPLVPVPYAPIP